MANLTALQESYLQGLRQITGANQKKAAVAASGDPRLGLGSRPRQAAASKEYAFFDRGDKLRTAFDISNKAMLASCLFWLLLCYLFYVVGGYGLVALRVMWDDGDLEGECKTKFSADPLVNLQTVQSYAKGDAGPYIARFASDHGPITDYPMESAYLPVVVTAAASAQYYQLQGLIRHLHQDLKPSHANIKLIVYDLGLYQREREILQQYCGCDVRTIDFSVYPDHISDTSNFAWRPLVIQTLLEEFGAVMYMEVTARFKGSNSMNFLKSRGSRDFLMWDVPAFTSIVAYTNKLTFKYLNETRCLFSESGLVDPQLMVFYKTNRTWTSVMMPWLKCALNLDCVAPRWSRYDSCLHPRRPKTTGCHRYDISAISVILNRYMQLTASGTINRHMPPRVTYFSDEEVVLFLEQPWTNGQLFLLFCVPLLLVGLMARRRIFRFCAGTVVR